MTSEPGALGLFQKRINCPAADHTGYRKAEPVRIRLHRTEDGNLLRAVFEKRNAVSCHRDAHPFHLTVQKDKSELKIFFLLRDVPKKIPFFF